MEAAKLIPGTGHEEGHQNGVFVPLPSSGNESLVLKKVNADVDRASEYSAKNGNRESDDEIDATGLIPSYTVQVSHESNASEKNNGSDVNKEPGVKKPNQSNQIKLMSQGKNKIEKPSTLKQGAPIVVKKSKGGKNVDATVTVSNGSLASNSRPKQPFKSRSSNDMQPSSAKQSGKPVATLTAMNMLTSEGPEKTKVKPARKEPQSKIEEDVESSSPTAGDTKPQRIGTLPAYSFSFKCDERAEKRKEFYSKIEEKIHAKEAEKTTLQAKSQESQEAELKMHRKSLTFKATPMPSFYQEPLPAKVELKKIPTTRAKSPKLGRKKDAHIADGGENSKQMSLVRLSLDEKVSQSNSTKGVSTVHTKKPQRKSLPKLPSENTALLSANTEAPPHAAPTIEPSDFLSKNDDEHVAEELISLEP